MGVTRQSREARHRKQPLEETPGVPGFLPFQLCKLQREPPSGAGWTHEVKLDGYRVQLRIAGGQATLFTRSGLDWTAKLPELAAVAGVLPDAILDGELCAVGPDGYSHFSGLVSAMASGRTQDLVIFLFDCLWEGAEDMRPYAQELRSERLRAVLAAAPRGARRIVDRHLRLVRPLELEGAPGDLLAAACALGWEGIVSKRLGVRYRGERSGAWIKAKCRPTLTVRIAGWKSERGAFKSLIAGIPEADGGLRYGGTIHTGYSDAKVRELLQHLKPLETARHAFTAGDPPRKTRDIHWVRPELWAEIEMAEFTAAGKLRQASYKALGQDL